MEVALEVVSGKSASGNVLRAFSMVFEGDFIFVGVGGSLFEGSLDDPNLGVGQVVFVVGCRGVGAARAVVQALGGNFSHLNRL